jgi:hypothetical protein
MAAALARGPQPVGIGSPVGCGDVATMSVLT